MLTKPTHFYVILLACLVSLSGRLSAQPQPYKLWYKQPARNWNEALPVGNGRLGVMVFGKVTDELLQLNESTLWSGGPADTNPNPDAKSYLPQVRKALFEENYELATTLLKKMQGRYTESYEPLGDLRIQQPFSSQPTDYYRDLNISDASATTRFTVDGVTYSREVFVSAPDQVIVVRLTASKPGALNFTASTKSQLRYRLAVINNRELALNGKAPAHTDPNYVGDNPQPIIYDDVSQCRGMRFALRVRALPSDGTVTTDTAGIHVSKATSVVLLLSAATSFNGFDKCPDKDGKDEQKLVVGYLNPAARKSYTTLKQAHQQDYQTYFNRVSLTLNPTKNGPDRQALPTDERLSRYATGEDDPTMESLYYQFGRYLLISSSRPTGTPANLQGIWNPHVRPPWSSNFTININTQMNYWPAEVSNLSEFHRPLFGLIKDVAVTGKATAQNFYGIGGWTAHHNTDIWGLSNPVGDLGKGSPLWANWAMGGAWLCQHLYEHYRFTGDKAFLRDTAYPLMKGAAQFCSDWLIPYKDGHLVTAPSTTPENVFVLPGGKQGEVSIATTMDMGIIRDLFTNVVEASTVLNTDVAFRQLISEKTSKLYPYQIGKKGNLQEWYKDFEDVDPQHRHVSHLFALHPGRSIAPLTTPDLAAAARKTLEIRGDGGTGWSKAWKINFWARLNDGNHAYKLLRELLKLSGVEGTQYANAGGTYPNLFCAHPPFQIDGNFGGIAGMSEMLLQSHLDHISLLAALPDQWKTGQVNGLRARGGFDIVEMAWQDGKVSKVVIRSTIGGNCRIRVPNALKASGGVALQSASGANPNPLFQGPTVPTAASPTAQVYDFMTQAGRNYTFTMQ
ncbi:glycoside hydrolase family 95 protein [Spirosoma agri]|uniref:Glycoside hydrolase family 95 protein n=1 Tax=Spirosoma agri TaxID=1987381 RepID=A0A6M0IJW7_9BACT|nr:glycoside hydrolase family 95 protein [Spirosoma agri]NEU67223.1 glycoside hydrolase family 95 protein [Spirosoma agri]